MRPSLLAAAVICCFFTACDRTDQTADKSKEPVALGEMPLVDLALLPGTVATVAHNKPLVVFCFSCDCPISRKYAPRLAQLHQDYRDRVSFLLLGVGNESDDEMRSALVLYGLTMPAVNQADHAIAKRFGVRTTTESLLLDANLSVVYRGAVDDGHGLNHDKEPEHRYLVDALEAVLSGKPVPLAETKAPGCEVSLAQHSPTENAVWSKDICPIVQEHCQDCHRADGGGPFPLITYEDVKRKRNVIKRVVASRSMPPWFADPHVGGPWANDRRLSDAQIEKIVGWIAADCPQGNPADEPPPRSWPGEWEIGKPDLVVQIEKPVQIPAQGTLGYQYINLDPHFTEDRWVQAVEMLPTSPQVVHHAQVFLALNGQELVQDKTPVNGGRPQCYFAAMAPGQLSQIYPAGTAKFIPKGGTFIFEIHYVPNGTATTDQMRLGLVFAKEKPKYAVNSFDIRNGQLDIPPGATDYAKSAEYALPTAARLLAFQPHMHLRGKSFLIELVMPDKSVRELLSVPAYDFDWQISYQAKQPIDVPKGTIIRVTGRFDNSENNPRLTKDDWTKRVKAGSETTDEMLVGFGEWHALQ